MLSHAGEGQGSENDANGSAGKAGSLRVNHDDVQIEHEKQTDRTDIDEADRHAVFGCKVTLVSGVAGQLLVSVKTFSIQEKTGQDADSKHDQEKAVGIELEGMAKLLIDRIKTGQLGSRIDSHGVVEEIKQKETEQAECQAAVV